MDAKSIADLGVASCFGFGTLGAIVGMAVNGPAVIGAWKKCALHKRPVQFIMVVFAATCLSNMFYSYITMDALANSTTLGAWKILGLGVFSGLGIGANAFCQAIVAASAADAYGETGQNYGQYLIIVGIAESFALIVMVFVMLIAS